MLLSSYLHTRPPPISTLIPYTTLFRSSSSPVSHAKSTPNSTLALLGLAFFQTSVNDCVTPSTEVWKKAKPSRASVRSEEHTSELQSRQYLVCRLLLEKNRKHEHRRTRR